MASGITVGASVTVAGQPGTVKAVFANGRLRVQVGRRVVKCTLAQVKLVRKPGKAGKVAGPRAPRPLLPCKAPGCKKHTIFVSKATGAQLCRKHRAALEATLASKAA